ncbi:MAG: hypothetical protein WC390_10880 [Sulfurimonas sp.]|jgi:hypothetical protein
MQRFQKISKKVTDKLSNNKVVAGVSAAVIGVQAQAAVVMPTADYTDIEAAAVIGFGIAITVGLLMKAKRFFA